MIDSNWYLYLIRTRYGALYTGITTDVARRMIEHTRGKNGAKYLRSKGPLRLVYHVQLDNRSLALMAEHRIRRLSKEKKEAIIQATPDAEMILQILGLGGSSV